MLVVIQCCLCLVSVSITRASVIIFNGYDPGVPKGAETHKYKRCEIINTKEPKKPVIRKMYETKSSSFMLNPLVYLFYKKAIKSFSACLFSKYSLILFFYTLCIIHLYAPLS